MTVASEKRRESVPWGECNESFGLMNYHTKISSINIIPWMSKSVAYKSNQSMCFRNSRLNLKKLGISHRSHHALITLANYSSMLYLD